ncbi:hypothetical protein ACGP04_15340 [Piscirickettsia salmonis]
MLGDFASLDVQNTYRGSDAYEYKVFFIWIDLSGIVKIEGFAKRE